MRCKNFWVFIFKLRYLVFNNHKFKVVDNLTVNDFELVVSFHDDIDQVLLDVDTFVLNNNCKVWNNFDLFSIISYVVFLECKVRGLLRVFSQFI